MNFEIIGKIEEVEPIAVGSAIRDIARLREQYAPDDGENLKALRLCAWQMAEFVKPKCIGMKPTASARRNSKLNATSNESHEKK